LESLIEPSGGASILGSHHTNQTSRKDGATMDATSVRGVSGIVDGTRWVSVVQVERITTDDKVESVVTLSMAKSNYSMMAAPVVLRYGEGGVLVPMSADERAEAGKVRDAADPRARKERKKEEAKANHEAKIDEAVIACVKAEAGIDAGTLRKQVKARAGCGSDAADTSVERLILANRIRRAKDGKPMRHFIVEAAPETTTKPEAAISNGVNGGGMAVHDHVPTLDDV
jgi:DNA-binding cell septation regulator SpoVG